MVPPQPTSIALALTLVRAETHSQAVRCQPKSLYVIVSQPESGVPIADPKGCASRRHTGARCLSMRVNMRVLTHIHYLSCSKPGIASRAALGLYDQHAVLAPNSATGCQLQLSLRSPSVSPYRCYIP